MTSDEAVSVVLAATAWAFAEPTRRAVSIAKEKTVTLTVTLSGIHAGPIVCTRLPQARQFIVWSSSLCSDIGPCNCSLQSSS